MFDVLDELIGPLNAHITELFSQPVTGTDDAVTHVDTKKAYLALLNNIMSSKLHGIFISERKRMCLVLRVPLINIIFREQGRL
jgi:exportin-T